MSLKFAQRSATGLLLLTVAACGGEGPVAGNDSEEVSELGQPLGITHAPVPSKELLVTDLSVVNDASYVNYAPGKWNIDPTGGFSLGRLVDNMFPYDKPSDRDRSDATMTWLRLWETPYTVNGQVVAARPLIRNTLITPWKLASIGKLGNTAATCTADPSTDFTCKLSFAPDVVPFRLLSVVYRPDLRRLPLAGVAGSGSAGQGRFVFGALDAARQPLSFTVIFEYMVPVKDTKGIQDYAAKWHALGTLPFGSTYNKQLQLLTQQFVKRGAAPQRANGSALLQVRTNEVALAEPGSDPSSSRGLMWELREFVLKPNGPLAPDTVKQEPPLELSGSALLGDWVAANAATVLAGTHDVPATFQGQPFLAGSALTPSVFTWAVPGAAEDVRHSFALSTCNGCHRGETNTSFLHVKGRQPDAPSVLSPFLEGELAGPRVADLTTLLNTDFSTTKNGKGRDHGHDEDENDGDSLINE
jgi:hypothetical protein